MRFRDVIAFNISKALETLLEWVEIKLYPGGWEQNLSTHGRYSPKEVEQYGNKEIELAPVASFSVGE